MKGFSYQVPERLQGPGFSTRTYESIRRNRPQVVAHLRQVASSTYQLDTPHTLYVAINIINSKLYVGVTSNFVGRVKGHLQGAGRGKGVFAAAIRKYGQYAFEFLVYARFNSFERALFAEQELIACILPEYNLTAGGEGNFGWDPSKETRQRMGAHRIGKAVPVETVRKMVATRLANGNYGGYWTGKKRSLETVAKIRASKAGTKFPYLSSEVMARRTESVRKENLSRQRAVRCVDDGSEFPSIKLAAAHYRITYSHMSRVVHGKAKSAHGRRFEFI